MNRILVRRTGGLGDVILTTPIVRRLRWENPDIEIAVQTAYPEVYRNNPHINDVTDDNTETRLIDLDLAYEREPGIHVVTAYMKAAFGDAGDPEDYQQELFFAAKSRNPRSLSRSFCVAVHAAQAGWRNRTLPSSTWATVCDRLKAFGLRPILVGTKRDTFPGYENHLCILDMDLHAQAQVIAQCCAFVGSDTAMLHVAGSTHVPIVGVFTSVDPAYRLPWRDGVLGKLCRAVQPKGLDCLGCQARRPIPSTTEGCERGDLACIQAVTPEQIITAVRELVG